MMTSVVVLLVFQFASASALLPLFEGASVTPRPKLGTNLPPVLTTAVYCPWKNLIRCAAEWTVRTQQNQWVNPRTVNLTSTGYPLGLQSTHMATTSVNSGLNGQYRSGTYVLTYSGSGVVSVGGDVQPVQSSSNGALTFVLSSGDLTNRGILITINSSSPLDPVRDLIVMQQSYAAVADATPWEPSWFALLDVPKWDTLRFTHMQREEYQGYVTRPNISWANRASQEYFTYATDAGVPHEMITDLVQRLDSSAPRNVWVSVPQFGSEEYITSMASYYRTKLPAESKLILEDSYQNGFQDVPTRRVERLKQIHRIFTSVFGTNEVATFPDNRNARVQVVVTCDLLCDRFDPFLNPNQTSTFDVNFRRAIIAFAISGSPLLGDQPWSSEKPNPFYLKYQSYLTDGKRIAQERLWDWEIDILKFIYKAALLDLPVFAFEGSANLAVPHYGMRWTDPNTTQAFIEGRVQEQFWAMEVGNDPTLKGLNAEWLERWFRMGGGLFVSTHVVAPGIRCVNHNTNIPGANRWQCNYPGLVQSPDAVLATSNKWQAYMEVLTALGISGLSTRSQTRGEAISYLNSTVANTVSAELPNPATDVCRPQCVFGDCVNGQCVCYNGYTSPDCSVFDESLLPNRCSPNDYGMNLGGLADWEPIWMWSDFMKFARKWIHQPVVQPNPQQFGWIWSYQGSSFQPTPYPSLDSDGYPWKLAPNDALSTFLRRDTYEYPHGGASKGSSTGLWHFYYDGDGSFDFGMDTHLIRRVRPGYYILQTRPLKQLNNGLWFQIIRTNPENRIRNIRVIPDSMKKTFHARPFHPLFLESLERYKSIRFMSAQRVGDEAGDGVCTHLTCPAGGVQNSTSSVRTPADMTPTTFFSQTAARDGLSIEYIVKLCNTLHIRPWINVPFNADDAYVAKQAQYVKANLNPRLKPIIEYSNEVWATHHYVGFYAADRGVQLFPQTSTDSTKARSCWYQRRSREIWRIYNDQGVAVTRVLAGQAVQTAVLRAALTCETSAMTGLVDWIAIAPYFGTALYDETRLLTIDEVFDRSPQAINASLEAVLDHKALADEFNISGVALYESGPGYFGGALAESPDVQELGLSIHRDPRMKDLILNFHAQLSQIPKAVMSMYFVGPAGRWGKYGAFGIREYQNQDPSTSFKVQGYETYANNFATCAPSSVKLQPGSCQDACSGHGFCLRLESTCECYLGYTGGNCQNSYLIPDVDFCNTYTCAAKNGSCLPVNQSNNGPTRASPIPTIDSFFQVYRCQGCSKGWMGWDCQTPSCDAVNQCSYRGKCIAPDACKCYRGFTGPKCDMDCGCSGHGSCSNSGSCVCDAGYWLTSDGCVPTCSCATCLAPNVCGCSTDCVYGSCWDGLCACWDGFEGADCSVRGPATGRNKDTAAMGINLDGIADWSSSNPFLNLMLRSRSWFLNPARVFNPDTRWTVNEPLRLTEDGYPAELPFDRVAGTFATRDNENYIAGGKYILMYDGEGRVETGMDARVIEATRSHGWMEVQYNPSRVLDNGFYIRIESTNVLNPVRNIRIFPPNFPYEAYAKAFIFTPPFLEELRSYRSIRFLNWVNLGLAVNLSQPLERTWKDRKRLTAASMATGVGVSEEYMILLCNILNAEPWFTIPHDANDEYIEKFALLLRSTLRPDVAIHIEHSNEVWNMEFQSNKYARLKGAKAFPSIATRDPQAAAMQYHGLRSQQIFDTFKRVFGPRQSGRLRFKLGAFVLIPSWTVTAMTQVTQRERLSIAITAYYCDEGTFGGSVVAMQLATAQLVERCLAAASDPSTFSYVQRFAALAAQYNVGLDAYEGGLGLVQYSVLFGGYARPGVAALYDSLHRDPSAALIVQKYSTAFKLHGIQMQMYFTAASRPSIFGSWGIKASTSEACDNAPKCRGLESWITSNGKNATARAVTWGLSEYGFYNVLSVNFTTSLSESERRAYADALAAAQGLASGSILSFPVETLGTRRSMESAQASSASVYFVYPFGQADSSVKASTLAMSASTLNLNSVAASAGVSISSSGLDRPTGRVAFGAVADNLTPQPMVFGPADGSPVPATTNSPRIAGPTTSRCSFSHPVLLWVIFAVFLEYFVL
jgi:hypothetical protein